MKRQLVDRRVHKRLPPRTNDRFPLPRIRTNRGCHIPQGCQNMYSQICHRLKEIWCCRNSPMRLKPINMFGILSDTVCCRILDHLPILRNVSTRSIWIAAIVQDTFHSINTWDDLDGRCKELNKRKTSDLIHLAKDLSDLALSTVQDRSPQWSHGCWKLWW